MGCLSYLFKKEGLIERYKVEGMDPSDRVCIFAEHDAPPPGVHPVMPHRRVPYNRTERF